MAITVPYSGTRQVAYQKICQYMKSQSLGADLKADDLKWDEANTSVTLAGKGFSACIECQEKSGSSVIVLTLKLSVLLRVFQAKIENQVMSHLEKALK